MAGAPWTLLNYAFRPFFLLGALHAILAIALWVLHLHGVLDTLGRPDPVLWHAHEMLFGFGGAAIAGFLFTAVATWTGRPQIAGPLLGWLVTLWVAGRLALLSPLPAGLVAMLDLLFPLMLTTLALREIVGGNSRRNYGIAAATGLLTALNALFHLGRAGVWPGADRLAILLILYLLLMLITVVAGRIVPSFTGSWLRLRGRADMPRTLPWLERALVPVTLLAALTDTAGAPAPVAAICLLAAAALHALRLSQWKGLSTAAEPLLIILHVAYAWLPIGFALLGLTALGLPLPRSAALHALTMGGVGGMILAVTTRVALGHTGRPLIAAPVTVAAYAMLNGAVLVRILSVMAPGAVLGWMDLAATGWLLAFGLFVWAYAPILTRPRPDGRAERRRAS